MSLDINEGKEWVLFLRLPGTLWYVRIVLLFETPDDAEDFARKCLNDDYAVFHIRDWPGNDSLHVEEMACIDAKSEGEPYLCLN